MNKIDWDLVVSELTIILVGGGFLAWCFYEAAVHPVWVYSDNLWLRLF